MPKENIDPEVEAERLRQVRTLVEALLLEQDVCGQVILAGREGRFENFTDVRASWSNLRLLEDENGVGVGVGLRSRIKDYDGDAALQKQHLEWSVGVASGFAQIGAQIALGWLDAAREMDDATNAEHTPLERDDPRDEP